MDYFRNKLSETSVPKVSCYLNAFKNPTHLAAYNIISINFPKVFRGVDTPAAKNFRKLYVGNKPSERNFPKLFRCMPGLRRCTYSYVIKPNRDQSSPKVSSDLAVLSVCHNCDSSSIRARFELDSIRESCHNCDSICARFEHSRKE